MSGTPTSISAGAECSLTIDLHPSTPALTAGDWIWTGAGSRYLLITARPVNSRAARHGNRTRYKLQVARLPRHCGIPPDVRAVQMSWYPRKRRR